MLKYIVCAIVSFSIGVFVNRLIMYFRKTKKSKRKTRFRKVKPLNQQDFKKAMKDLEIK